MSDEYTVRDTFHFSSPDVSRTRYSSCLRIMLLIDLSLINPLRMHYTERHCCPVQQSDSNPYYSHAGPV